MNNIENNNINVQNIENNIEDIKNNDNNIKNNINYDDSKIKILEQNIFNLKEQIKELENKSEKHWDLFVRSQAEIENIKKIHIKEYENIKEYSLTSFSLELLNIVDSLEQGLNIVNKSDDLNNLNQFKKGMNLVHKLLITILNKFGIHKMNAKDQIFNPTLHEVISIKNVDGEKNIIVDILQDGYTYKKKILRHAKVVISN